MVAPVQRAWGGYRERGEFYASGRLEPEKLGCSGKRNPNFLTFIKSFLPRYVKVRPSLDDYPGSSG
jgi:hypothetical protein